MERINFSDLRVLCRLAIFAIIAGLVPYRIFSSLRSGWARISGRLGMSRFKAGSDADLLNKINEIVPNTGDDPLRAMSLRQMACRTSDDAFFLMRDYWPGGWQPTLNLIGAENVDTALAEGKGAILWVARFDASRLAWKKALRQNGYEVAHLSTPNHGFSPTRFGIRVLNPVCTNREDRYIQERVLLHVEAPVKALRRMREHLDANRLVSISDIAKADKPITVPFLGRTRIIAPGAPSLSMASGAPILPVFPVRVGDDTFDIIIEEPIDRPIDQKGPDARKFLAAEYARRLEKYVRARPETWEEWWCVD